MLKTVYIRQSIVMIGCLFFLTSLHGQHANDILKRYLDTVSNGDVSKWDKIKSTYTTTVNYSIPEDSKTTVHLLRNNKVSYGKTYKVWPNKVKVELYSDSLFLNLTSSFYFLDDKRIIVLGNSAPLELDGNKVILDLYPTTVKKRMDDSRKITFSGMKSVTGVQSQLYEIIIETAEKQSRFYFFNTQTYLLEAIYDPEFNIYTIISDYRDFDGYLIPTYIASMKDGMIFSWEICKNIIFNQPIAKEKFNYK